MKLLLWIVKRLLYRKTRYSHVLAFIRYNSPRKLLNLIHVILERKLNRINLKSKPFLINSEPMARCNFQCPFCPTGKRNTRDQKPASLETYHQLLEQLGKYCYRITLHGWGEPLMHKNLTEMIRMAHQNRILTVVTTNGSLLTPAIAASFVSCGLDYLCISIDGITEESYSRYRIGGHLPQVMDNLRELLRIRAEMKSRTPFIEWQFLVFRHNEHECEAVEKMAKQMGVDNLVFLPAYTEDPEWDASDPAFRLPKGSPLANRRDCKHLWTTLTLHSNGDIVPCCYDFHGNTPYANILKDSFPEFWNNPFFQQSRQMITTGHTRFNQDLPCKKC